MRKTKWINSQSNPQTDSCCEVRPDQSLPKPENACSADACPAPTREAGLARCPVTGTVGRKVDRITLKALLRSEALRRLDGGRYFFCPAPDCDVVYFNNEAGSVFRKGDLTVRVGLKEKDAPIPICYCFGIMIEDIRRELAESGNTQIPAMITAEVKAGHCACEVRNPQGNCCLGNVLKAVERIKFATTNGHHI